MIAEEVDLVNSDIVSYKRNITYKIVCEDENGIIPKFDLDDYELLTEAEKDNIDCGKVIDKIETTNIPETINYGSQDVITSLIAEIQKLNDNQQDICKEDNAKYNKYDWCDLQVAQL